MVGGDDLGWASRLPCLPSSPLRKEPIAECVKFDPKSHAEEIAEHLVFKVFLEKMTEARRRIIKTGKKSGSIVCPKCDQNNISFSVASNGHVWARCPTQDCLRWME
jgi:hypothetical protein